MRERVETRHSVLQGALAGGSKKQAVRAQTERLKSKGNKTSRNREHKVWKREDRVALCVRASFCVCVLSAVSIVFGRDQGDDNSGKKVDWVCKGKVTN